MIVKSIATRVRNKQVFWVFSQHLSLKLMSYLCVFPVLVSFHAMARIDHEELSSEVHASFVSPDLSLLTQHPVLGTASVNDDSVCVCVCACVHVRACVHVCMFSVLKWMIWFRSNYTIRWSSERHWQQVGDPTVLELQTITKYWWFIQNYNMLAC